MALEKIGVRSPRMISATGTVGQDTRVEVFLWNSPDSIPATAQIIASKPIPTAEILTVYYDVSEYARNYINHVSFSSEVVDTAAPVTEYCYMTVKTYVNEVLTATDEFICFNAYGYYTEGSNPTLDEVLLDAGTYLVNETGDLGSIYSIDDGLDSWTIAYQPLTAATPITTVALTQDVAMSPYVHPDFRGLGGNRVTVYKNLVAQKAFTFKEVCEPKYEVYLCDFVNKYGVWQKLTFFKVSKSSFSVTSNEYKLMPSAISYNTAENRVQNFNVNGKETIKLNTGWVEESYSEVIKQLMLSEEIRVNNLPVNISTKSVELKKSINDKNINYEIDFTFAYDTINNIQ